MMRMMRRVGDNAVDESTLLDRLRKAESWWVDTGSILLPHCVCLECSTVG